VVSLRRGARRIEATRWLRTALYRLLHRSDYGQGTNTTLSQFGLRCQSRASASVGQWDTALAPDSGIRGRRVRPIFGGGMPGCTNLRRRSGDRQRVLDCRPATSLWIEQGSFHPQSSIEAPWKVWRLNSTDGQIRRIPSFFDLSAQFQSGDLTPAGDQYAPLSAPRLNRRCW
jgi:hypothetical protein